MILRGTDRAKVVTARHIGFAELLAKLGRAPNETVTICSDAPGQFRCVGRPYVNRAAEVVQQYQDANCWFGVNPVRPLADYGRGKAADITRLAAVPADLDFAENKCGSPETAFKIRIAAPAKLRTVPNRYRARDAFGGVVRLRRAT